ncbi:MAG: ABC transporter substrate-binding protein [Chloroflexota bacterium]|nr:ABC transporter substrate-binding protein [Chloroflexota bacterium]
MSITRGHAAATRPPRWRFGATLMLIVPLLLGASLGDARAQDEPLRIGTLFPITGDLSDFGPAFFNSAELAVNQINEGGGVNGQPVELIPGDTATSPQQAVEEARRMIEIEGVSALVGPAGSGEALPVAESVAGPAGVPVISPSATSPALSVANDNGVFFRTTISDAAQGVVIADLALEQGYATACVLYVNNAYGQGLNDAFAERFTAEGGEVTEQVPHEQEQASYASELATCTADSPDVMIAIGYPESGGVFLRELIEAGDPPALLLSDGLLSEDLFAELGWESFAGTIGTAPGGAESAASTAYSEAYNEAYGEAQAVPYLREVYDAVFLIAAAAQAAGANDAASILGELQAVASAPGTVFTGGVEGWQAATAALAAGEDVDYEGASGPVDLDENGDVVLGAIRVWSVEGEAIVDLETREIDLSGAAAEATPTS